MLLDGSDDGAKSCHCVGPAVVEDGERGERRRLRHSSIYEVRETCGGFLSHVHRKKGRNWMMQLGNF